MKIVVKVGGSLLKEGIPESLVRDVSSISRTNQLILVHGGGEMVTDIATKLGKEQKFVVSPEGIRSRYTDRDTAEVYQMVMSGLLGKRLALSLTKYGARGLSVSGTDGSLLQAKRKSRLVIMDDRGRKVAIDGGYTGKVQSVNVELIDGLQAMGYLPVISPVATGEDSVPLNVDGDRAASALAISLGADTVVFATNVDGLSLAGNFISRISPDEAEARLPEIGFGMQKKVMAAVEAVRGGVKEGIICSGNGSTPLTSALAHEGCTVVSQR